MTRAPVTICAALSAACSSAPAELWHRPAFDPAPFLASSASDFAGASAVLDGFAPADDDPAMRVGDSALLGVEIHRGGEIERVLLLLEVRDLCVATQEIDGVPVSQRPTLTYQHKVTHIDGKTRAETVEKIDVDVFAIRVDLTRCDAEGRRRQTSEAILLEQALTTGLWPTTITDATLEQHALASLCSRSLQGVAREDVVLQELLFRVVERPGLWSIVSNFGIEVTPIWMPAVDRSTSIEFAPLSTAARPLTLMLLVNSAVVLWVDLFVTKPSGPTAVCGGIVGAIARHPTEPGRFAVARLLATRRAPEVEP